MLWSANNIHKVISCLFFFDPLHVVSMVSNRTHIWCLAATWQFPTTYQPKVLMVGGMTLCAIADVGTGLASSLPFLIVARLMLGAGLSSSDAGASAWVADATAPCFFVQMMGKKQWCWKRNDEQHTGFSKHMVWICFWIDERIWERKDPAWHFLRNFGCLTSAHIATLRNDSGLVLAPASIGNQAVSFWFMKRGPFKFGDLFYCTVETVVFIAHMNPPISTMWYDKSIFLAWSLPSFQQQQALPQGNSPWNPCLLSGSSKCSDCICLRDWPRSWWLVGGRIWNLRQPLLMGPDGDRPPKSQKRMGEQVLGP